MKPKFTAKDARQGMRDWGMATQGIFGKSHYVPDEIPRTLHKRTFAEQKAVNADVRGEADVLRECLAWLHHDPRVAITERHNSGALPNEAGRYVKFNRVRVSGTNGGIKPLISDITGTLKNGRAYAIECKTPTWKRPDFDALMEKDGLLSDKELRELGQAAYLSAIRNAGGIGIFAISVDDVISAMGAT